MEFVISSNDGINSGSAIEVEKMIASNLKDALPVIFFSLANSLCVFVKDEKVNKQVTEVIC